MKIRIEQKQLADAAKRAHRRLPNNPPAPIMGGLVLEAADTGAVTLSGFDYETSTRSTLDATILEPGVVVVSGRMLADVTAALPAGPVDLVGDEYHLEVSTPGNQFQLPVMARNDYPALPEAPGPSGTVEGTGFAAAVVHAATVAMPQKDAVGRFEAFGGVSVAAVDGTLWVRASDSYRMVQYALPWAEADGSLLIPASDLAATAKALDGGQVTIGFPAPGKGVASLSNNSVTATGRCIATDFPDITRLFPSKDAAQGKATFDAADLAAAVKRAGLVNESDVKPIRIAFDTEGATVSGGSGGPSGRTRIDADHEDLDGFEICYRPGYLASVIAPVEGSVHMWFATPTKPALVEPADSDTYRAVLMPVRV
ncbi:DNA polymerase III subunit beta [Streptomyces californicus]